MSCSHARWQKGYKVTVVHSFIIFFAGGFFFFSWSSISVCGRVAGTGVSVFSLHPGVVQSDLWRHQHRCIQMAVKIFRVFTKTTVEGAQTTIYCAVEPHLESQSGGYFRYKQQFNSRIVTKAFRAQVPPFFMGAVFIIIISAY